MRKMSLWFVRLLVVLLLVTQLIPVQHVSGFESDLENNLIQTNGPESQGHSDEQVDSKTDDEKGLAEADSFSDDVMVKPEPVLLAGSGMAKPIDDAVKSIIITDDKDEIVTQPIGMWSAAKVTLKLELPNNVVKKGDYTIVTLPQGFNITVFDPFELKDANGNVFANVSYEIDGAPAGSPSEDRVKIVYTDKVETLSDITGNVFFKMRVDHEYIKVEQSVDTTFIVNNHVMIVANPSSIDFQGIPPLIPHEFAKAGWFENPKSNSIQYRLVINQQDPVTGLGKAYSNVVVTDVLESSMWPIAQIDTSTMMVFKGKWVPNDFATEMRLDNPQPVYPTIVYNPELTGFAIDLGDIAEHEGYMIEYKVKTNHNFLNGDSIGNTAVFKSTSTGEYIRHVDAVFQGAGGDAAGASFKIVINKNNESNQPLADVEFELFRVRFGIVVGTYTTDSDGKITIDHLVKDEYRLRETKVPLGYQLLDHEIVVTEADFDTNKVAHLNVVNKKATIQISGEKTWNDADNQDGLRPSQITVVLNANGVKQDEKVITKEDNWRYRFDNLPTVTDMGVPIVYTVDEFDIPEYTKSVEGYNLKNTHVPSLVDIEVSKVWIDNNNQDGIRPQSIQVQLVADHEDVAGRVVELNQGNGWHATFDNLPEYKAGQKIIYSVREVGVPVGYNVLIQQLNELTFEIKNTHTPQVIEISGQKHWEDNNNQDGVRPTEITVILKADDVVKEEKVVTATDNWSYTFSNLPKYRDQGVAIVYTIEEKPVANYEVEVNGFDLVNKHTPEVIEISGQKEWVDNNNQDGVRPTEITVILKADGVVKEEKVVKATDNWSYTFSNLPKYRDQGVAIVYTVEEKPVDDYQTGYNPNNYDIVNVHTPEVIEISGQKHWEDADNQDGVRPAQITVILKADGVVKEEKVVTATDNWSYTFSNLPKYRDQGVLVVYTVEEKPVANYEVEVNGYDLVNKHTPQVIEISGQKHWEDANNQDGVRPTEIIVILKANGEVVAEKVVKAEDGWKYTFENLPKFKAGKEIVYTIEEKAVDNYQTGYNPNNYDIVNVHTPEVIEISGQKHWEDENNQDGVRPTEIIVILKANGEVVAEKVVKAEDGWKYTFENLPKFKAGKEIVYTIEEKAVDGYTSVIKAGQFDITNTHKPEMVEIGVEKVWQDEQNQDGSRPQTITVVLLANGEKVAGKTIELSASVNWKGVFENLPKYKDGQVIKYSVEEVNVPKGYKAVVTEKGTYQFIITNSHTPELPNTGMSHGAEVGLLALGCLLVGVLLIGKKKY